MTSLQLSDRFRREFAGDFCQDLTMRKLYATDASIYQELPLAVALPRNERDIELLIDLARTWRVGLIPRTAGTSLAGQVVGSGIVVDVSRHWNTILEINPQQRWVRVQPGVIRNELNLALRPHGLLFGPETSTANRAMLGGMLGNNSCGSNSVVYGSTRDRLLELVGYFSDGSRVTLADMTPDEFHRFADVRGESRLSQVYHCLGKMLTNQANQEAIVREFPDSRVTRRNTGYALDLLAQTAPFVEGGPAFNLGQLIAGSEGTLFFATELKLRCDPLPSAESAVLAAHFHSIDEALRANLVAMQFKPFASELIDHHILAGAARNRSQRENMDFVRDEPAAILMVQLRSDQRPELESQMNRLVGELQSKNLGHYFPLLFDRDEAKAWELRKAGLGVVANVPGDTKPVTVIEDVAVSIEQLPDYIAELNQLLRDRYGFECVHYGHAGSGELHLRPLVNLKTKAGREQFVGLANDVAELVKKYRGSLSGEHGDGRLRAPFLKRMVGKHNYALLRDLKHAFDPENLFNPGKIIDSPPLTESTRFDAVIDEGPPKPVCTVMDFSESFGMLGAAEMCSGSGDCRKTELAGGTMCPSYMATRDEKDSTRARANILRHALGDPRAVDPLDNEEIRQVMELCLSCKGCKSECPSNVDVAKLKAEFTHAYQRKHGVPFRSRLFASIAKANQLNSIAPWFYNGIVGHPWTSAWFKQIAGVHPNRSLPRLHAVTLRHWFRKRQPHPNAGSRGEVCLFCDEFTNYNDVSVGQAAIELLEHSGFRVHLPAHTESGRAAISKGLLGQAQKAAIENVRCLSAATSEQVPLIGLEPSAILSFRDEYLDLVPPELKADAQALAKRTWMLDEWMVERSRREQLGDLRFRGEARTVYLHGHCHQKALASLKATIQMLQLPPHYRVQVIPSGCCGMAGSFGYEREHYDVSMKIGELVLFPAVRKMPNDALLAAPGTSCRHQIADGTDRQALHPVEILRDALEVED